MTDKEKEYSERAKDWKNISVNQISFTNNLVSTLSVGYFLYLIDKFPNGGIKLVWFDEIDWKTTLFVLIIILVMMSVLIGILILLSRLCDFRITRNISLTRKRIYKKHNQLMPESTVQRKGVVSLIYIIFSNIDSIQITDCDNYTDVLIEKFNNLRIQSKTLGSWTWKLTKIQLIVIFISGMIHFISVIM